MTDEVFQNYSKKHVQFYTEELSALLETGLTLAGKISKKPKIVDLGCGDGRVIFALTKKGLLKHVGEIVGVDLSDNRIALLTRELPFVRGIVSDALNVTALPFSSADFIICSQLIEHVENESMLLLEIKRILKKNGLLYISSVIKKKYGVYFYYRHGSFRIDYTHLREYSSAKEFINLLRRSGFQTVDIKTRQIAYPVLDIVIRTLIRIGLTEPNTLFFQQYPLINAIRRIRIPVLGYNSIEVLAKKVE